MVTGSPTNWNSMKAMKATDNMTTRAWTRRRRMKASMKRERPRSQRGLATHKAAMMAKGARDILPGKP